MREWIGFSDNSYTAENSDERNIFYELLSPTEIDGEIRPPKLQNANRQVRQLKDIVDKPMPLKILSDPEKEFEEAVKSAEDETMHDETGLLEHSLSVALHSLKEPSIDAWLEPSERSQKVWNELVSLVDKVRKMMNSNEDV